MREFLSINNCIVPKGAFDFFLTLKYPTITACDPSSCLLLASVILPAFLPINHYFVRFRSDLLASNKAPLYRYAFKKWNPMCMTRKRDSRIEIQMTFTTFLPCLPHTRQMWPLAIRHQHDRHHGPVAFTFRRRIELPE